MTEDQDKFREHELTSSVDGTQARSPVGLLDAALAESGSSSKTLKPGAIVAQRYEVLELIGKGAMGCVYRVRQLALHKELALKTLNPVSATDVNIRRFRNEAVAAAKLDHPNLVRAIDYGWLGAQPYLVMDLVEGPTLAQHLKKVATLPLETTLQIFTPICFALAYAHAEGVIHRDLKPSNIVLSPCNDKPNSFVAKLVDFGIAKLDTEEGGLTKTGEVFGTPLYMSPEQCLGSKVDNRSDIYSLGCVLYETLTGAPPFVGQNALETMMQHRALTQLSLKQAALGHEFPPALETVISKMLAKNPSDRYQSCLEVAQDLTLLQQGRIDLLEKRKGNSERVSNRKILILIAFIMLTISGGLIALFPDQKNYTTIKPNSEAMPNIDQTLTPPSTVSMTDGTEQKFSKIVGKPPKEMRVFDFGNRNIGTISHMGDGIGEKLESKQALGKVSFPKNYPLFLDVPFPLVYREPHLLSRFESDDLQGLKLNYPTAAAMMDLQAQSVEGTLAFASHLKQLKYLQLPAPVTTRAILNLHMEDLTQLNTLIISRTEIDCAQLAPYHRTLNHLRILDVSNLKNVVSLLKVLHGSTRMISLTLDNTGLKDADLNYITKMPNLQTLQISRNDISNTGIAKLTQLHDLKNLIIHHTHVTSACADVLASMPTLEYVRLPEGLRKDEFMLKHRLPKCRIAFGY